jgi:hypothetical protein
MSKQMKTILAVISSLMVVKNPRKDSIVLSGVAPGNFFDSHDAAGATVDAPHRVQKEDEKPPQGDELKAPFGELVVTGRRQMGARADCGRPLARSRGHFDALLVGTQVGVLVDKTPETMVSGLES